MIDTGKYQNEIKDLPLLEVGNYENIFKIFQASVDDKNFYTYNILKNIEFPEIDSSYIKYYTPNKRMALTIVSYEIYEDIRSWWIIYLLNKDKFTGAPFYVEAGVQLKYIIDVFRSSIYEDITNSTIFGGKHY
jgi:hypothetical protein